MKVAVIKCASYPGHISKDRLEETNAAGLADLQRLVGGGSIQLVPHKDACDAPFMAYVNEEGLIKDMPQNDLASLVLDALGFLLWPPAMTIYGPVVIMRQEEKSLRKKDMQQLETTLIRIIKECGEEEEPELKKAKEEAD